MKNREKTEATTCDSIFALLSDDEVDHVREMETQIRLSEGEEYIDLGRPDRGVQIARREAGETMERLLPRKAVHKTTWSRILAHLSAPVASTVDSAKTKGKTIIRVPGTGSHASKVTKRTA